MSSHESQQNPLIPQPSMSSTSISTTLESAPKNSSKIAVLLKAAGNAPILKNKNWELDETRTVVYLVQFLRKILKLGVDQSLFIFVNQSFAPSPEHTIGVLHRCFGGGSSKLTLHYSTTMAWG